MTAENTDKGQTPIEADSQGHCALGDGLGARKKYTYVVTSGGVDHTGWWKYTVRRSDGRETKITKARAAQLNREHRIAF